MTGHRRPKTCKLEIVPPPGEACWTEVLVESERSVAGDVLFKKGHIARDWRRRASMMTDGDPRTGLGDWWLWKETEEREGSVRKVEAEVRESSEGACERSEYKAHDSSRFVLYWVSARRTNDGADL